MMNHDEIPYAAQTKWASKDEIDAAGVLIDGDAKSGVVVGRIMLDRDYVAITPAHPLFAKRYSPDKHWRLDGLFPRYVQKRDGFGLPALKMNPQVVREEKHLCDSGPGHVLVIAPCRSGKGTGIIVPTLMTWNESVVIHDFLGENWRLSSGFRKDAGQTVLKFEPTCVDGSTVRWNPLDEIRLFSAYDAQDAQFLMNMICDPERGLEDHWAVVSRSLLAALALHLAYTGNGAGTMNGVATFLHRAQTDGALTMFSAMQTAQHDPEGKMKWRDSCDEPSRTHPFVANAAIMMLSMSDVERAAVLSFAGAFVLSFMDPVVASNTCRSDFLVRDLMQSDMPVSLYFVNHPHESARLMPLARVFFEMVMRRNSSSNAGDVNGYKHRLLMVFDDLAIFGKLPFLEESLAYVAGYGIKCLLVSQSIGQLKNCYGDNQKIVAGCQVRVMYGPNDRETAEYVSTFWGTVNTQEATTAAITPSEILAYGKRDLILFVHGCKPISGEKSFFFEDPKMLHFSKISPIGKI